MQATADKPPASGPKPGSKRDPKDDLKVFTPP